MGTHAGGMTHAPIHTHGTQSHNSSSCFATAHHSFASSVCLLPIKQSHGRVATQATAVQMDGGGLHARSRRCFSSQDLLPHLCLSSSYPRCSHLPTRCCLIVSIGHVKVVAPSPYCPTNSSSRRLSSPLVTSHCFASRVLALSILNAECTQADRP